MDLIRTKGIVGLYKGTAATMLRDVGFSVIYFPLFARLNDLVRQRILNVDAARDLKYCGNAFSVNASCRGLKAPGADAVPFWYSFLCGMGAGAFAAAAVTPADGKPLMLQ